MIATLSERTTLAEALTMNLVATDARRAEWDGDRCAVCGKTVRAGQRIADLTGGRGLVHVLRCAGMADASRRARAATAAAREPQPEQRRPAARGAARGSSRSATRLSEATQAPGANSRAGTAA